MISKIVGSGTGLVLLVVVYNRVVMNHSRHQFTYCIVIVNYEINARFLSILQIVLVDVRTDILLFFHMYVSIIDRFALLYLTFYILRGPVNLLIHVFYLDCITVNVKVLQKKKQTKKNIITKQLIKMAGFFFIQTRFRQIKKKNSSYL